MSFLGLYNYIVFIILFSLGLYMIIAESNLIRKLIGMNILQTSVLLLYISLGYVKNSYIPILNQDSTVYTNPIPHVLMLTAIVVGIANLAVGLSLVVRIENSFATVEENQITNLRK